MKIIHIFYSLKFSGAEIMYVDAAPFFQEKGCELTVMATSDVLGEYATFFELSGYKVMHQPMPMLTHYLRRIIYYYRVVKLLKKEHYDVVHIHSSAARWGFALCAWLAKSKSVYTFHAIFPTRLLTYPYHCLLRWSAKRIFGCRFQTISDSVFDHELKLYHNKTTKVHNWYGNTRFFPALEEEKEVLRRELGINENAFVLISIGGCDNNKRHRDIICAFSIILKKIPDSFYLHLGKGCTESEEIQLANNLGIANKILFCGNQEIVRKYLVAADVYLMTSKCEGISITTIEAMSCNIPAILYDVPGLRDFNKDGKNCILIPEDHHILADCVTELRDDKIEMWKMTESAKILVNEKFNIVNNVNRIYDMYL